MNLKSVFQAILLSCMFVLFSGGMIYTVGWLFESFSYNKNVSSVSDGIISAQQGGQNLPQRNWSVQDLNPQAKAVLSVEYDGLKQDKVLLGRNEMNRLPIASLVKLMTAMIVLDNYNVLSETTISKIADTKDPVLPDIKLGDKMSVENLLYIMLIDSSNKSAYALSEAMGEEEFVNLMNQKAQSLGLKDTFFAEPTGLSDQNYSTAKDLSLLAEEILKHYPKIAEITRIKEFDMPNFGKLINTDELLDQIPDVVTSKTGFTINAKGCLLLVVNNLKNNDYLIYVILGSSDRFTEMTKLIDWTNSAYKWQ